MVGAALKRLLAHRVRLKRPDLAFQMRGKLRTATAGAEFRLIQRKLRPAVLGRGPRHSLLQPRLL